MNNQETINQLESLKLNGMAGYFRQVETLPVQERPSLELFMARLTEAEALYRSQKRTERYLKSSKLRYDSTVEGVICSAEHNISKDTLSKLADCSFIDRAENILITGKTGCGKSYLACAVGREACLKGYRVLYLPMGKFIEEISVAKADGTLIKLMNKISKNNMIIFDDFALQPIDNNARIALLQILEDCYERKSIVVTSQLPVQKWWDYLKEPTLSDAILDRLTANAHRIELKGPSLRPKLKN